jgi:hypothetical protein
MIKVELKLLQIPYIRSLSEHYLNYPIYLLEIIAASQYGNTQPLERNKNIARMNRTRKSPNNELQMAYCGDRDTVVFSSSTGSIIFSRSYV